MNLYAFLPLVSFLLLIAGGLYLVRKKPAVAYYRLLGVCCFILCFVELGQFMLFISPNEARAIFWQRWVLAGLLFLPFFWTLLSLVFARENYLALIKKWRWYLASLLLLSLWFLTIMIRESVIIDAEALVNGYGFALSPAGRYFLIFLLLTSVLILLNFESTYRSSRDKQKKGIKYAIKGMSIFIGSYVMLISLALLFSYIDNRFTLLNSIAIVVGFLLVAYSVIKYGLLETGVYVGRQAIYTSATLSIVGFYLVMVGVIAKLFMSIGFNLNSFLSFLAAFFVFFLFVSIIFSRSLKQRLNLFVDRSFYKNKYDYRREWANLSERLGVILDINELISEVKRIVKQILDVDSADVLLENQDPALMQWLLRYGEPISIQVLSNRQPMLYEKNKDFLEKLGARILVSLNVKQKLFGMLVIGGRINGKEFSSEDIELLKIISQQVSIAILNSKLSEELIASREMEHFHKLSSFLIHDLKNFVSTLSMIVQNAANNFSNPKFQNDTLATISNTIDRMNRLMQKLSNLPKKLELRLKPQDLNLLIEEVIKKLKIQDNKSIKLSRLFNHLPRINIDGEYIQNVIQNFFLNAIEAMPDGGNLVIKTSLEKDVSLSNGSHVQMTISDTGCGMSDEFIQGRLFKPFQSSKHKGLGIGLFQCRTILEAHGGQIVVQSREGKGTTFIARLPVG